MFSPGLLSTKTNPRLASRVNGVLFQLPVSPGEFSHSDNSNHAMSLGLSQYRAGSVAATTIFPSATTTSAPPTTPWRLGSGMCLRPRLILT